MPITIVHRADGRALDHKSITDAKGFACLNGTWADEKNNLANAKAFISKLVDSSYDTAGLKGFELATEILTPVQSQLKGKDGKPIMTQPSLIDVSAAIKRILKDKRAFWVSTSVNQECGGYNNGKNRVYQFTLPRPLETFIIQGGKLVKGARKNNLTAGICMDGADLASSKIIAINSGPLNDVELSFLTPLKIKWAAQIAGPT